MSNDKRIVEVRLIVIVLIDITNHEFTDTLAASGSKHIREVIASEIVSNLESVAYIESVIVSQL